jgi:hypothetical protein
MKLNLLRVTLAVLLVFIPLYPKFPLAFAAGSQVAFRLDDIIVSLSLLIWMIYQVKSGFPILRQKMSWLIFAYWLSLIASLLNAFLIYQTTPDTQLILHTLRRFEYMSLFFITFSALSTKDYKFPLPFALLAFFGVFAYGMGQKYFQFPVVSTMNFEFAQGQLLQMDVWTRISATFAGHYDLAAYLSIFSALALGLSFLAKRLSVNLVLKLSWVLSFYLLTQTASRISTFAYWGGSVLMLMLLRKFIWVVPVSALMITSFVTSADLNQRLLATIPALRGTFSPSTNTTPIPTPTVLLQPTPTPMPNVPTEAPVIPTPTVFRHLAPTHPPIDVDAGVARSGEIRFKVEWPRALRAFEKNRLLGTGAGSLGLATDNDYLRLIGESGVLGALTFLLIFVHLALLSWRKRSSPLTAIFLSSIVIFWANAIFIDVFEASKTAYLFWILIGVFYYHLTTTNHDRFKT